MKSSKKRVRSKFRRGKKLVVEKKIKKPEPFAKSSVRVLNQNLIPSKLEYGGVMLDSLVRSKIKFCLGGQIQLTLITCQRKSLMEVERPGRSKVMIRMALGVLAVLFVLLGLCWSMVRRADREEFFAAFGTILLTVFLRRMVVNGVQLLVRANDYYLKSIGHFFVHRIALLAASASAEIQCLVVSLQDRLNKSIFTMRRQLCRRIAVSGLVVTIAPTTPIKLFPARCCGGWKGVGYITTTLKKHSNRVYPQWLLCYSFNCSTKFLINGLV
jgi:hypothetical protein